MTAAPARVRRSAFWPLQSLRIAVDPAPDAPMSPEQQARWQALCAGNPALFDGPIYTVTCGLPGEQGGVARAADAPPGQRIGQAPRPLEPKVATRNAGHTPGATLRCRRSRYHEILLRRPGEPGMLLSVTALLLCDQHVLLGRRGSRLRSYPGMWEIGPAGGLDPRPIPTGERAGDPTELDPAELGPAEIQAALGAEIREEIGLQVDVRSARLLGVCADEAARSLDIVMQLELPLPMPMLRHGEGWEYQDAGWTPIAQLPSVVQERPVIAPSLAIMLALGWIDQPPPAPGADGSP